MRAIDPVTLIKKVGVKVNSKPWCVSASSAKDATRKEMLLL